MTDAAVDVVGGVVALVSLAPALAVCRRRAAPVPIALWLLSNLGAAMPLGVFGTTPDGHPLLFAVMRLWCWILFAWWPLALFAAAALRRESRVEARALGGIGLAVAAVGVDAFFVEPHLLVVRQETVAVDGLAEPVRIALIADLQTDRVGAYERDVLRRAARFDPDLVAWAGDVITGPDEDNRALQLGLLRDAIAAAGLAPPLGHLVVQGNIDHPTRWAMDLEGVGLTPITGTQELGPLTVTGFDLETSFTPTLHVPHAGGPHVALGHAPDYALGDVRADVLLAGHTHGGQVQLPIIGPLVTFSAVPRAWAEGRTALDGGRTLVVSRGIGMERGHAPRLRFLCRPELVIVDLVPR